MGLETGDDVIVNDPKRTPTTAQAAQSLRFSEERFRLLVESVQDYAIFMLDPDGIVSTWNIGAQKIKGYQPAEIIGKHFSIFYPPEATSADWPAQELAYARRLGRFEDEGWRVRKDGSRFWASVIITALRDENGEITGFAKITRDLSERKAHEESLRLSEERFRLLLEGVQDYAIFTLDPDGRIASWNIGARNLTGYATEEVLGQHISLFYSHRERAAGLPAQDLDSALAIGRLAGEVWRLRKDGSMFCASEQTTPLYSSDGTLRGFARMMRDMSERKRLEELERSSRRMSEFLAVLAHELRNPLAPIRNAVGILQLGRTDPANIQKCCGLIDRQLFQLTRLVDDLLDVGRIATGKIVLRKERLVFQEVIARSVETMRPFLDGRKHLLEVQVPAEPIHLDGDPVRLSQIVQNLLSNAGKYTPPGGRISLNVVVEDKTVTTTVTDNGRGMAAEALERVFELFNQEGPPGSSADSGLGIGLTLARSLTEIHGGALTASSAGLGQGSTFALCLPCQPENRGTANVGCANATPARNSVRRVLVVDDNKDSADSMAAMIDLLGHEVRVAYSGQDALRIAEHFRPKLVLLDIAMPGMSGVDVQSRMRRLPGLDEATIAAMTGFGQEEDRKRTLQSGFDLHLTKPVESGQISRLLNDLD